MRIGDRFTLKIQSIAFGGHGVGRSDGLVIFVPLTAPGDVVEVEIVERKKKFARGNLLEVVESSSQRTRPLCRYYGRCGGCAYQHISYPDQLEIKRRQVCETFAKIGGQESAPVAEVIPSPRPYAYRGKATLHSVKTSQDHALGFMDVTGGKIVDIERCEIVDENINDQIQATRANRSTLPDSGDLIFWSGADESAESVVRVVKGREFLVPRTGFFQTNLYLTERMVGEVCLLASRKKRRTIIDACCGSGLFSIFLAPYAEKIIGVEINEKSVAYAQDNAARQGVRNTAFIAADIEKGLKDLTRLADEVDLIVLDPPRTGLAPGTLAGLPGFKSPDIIYISCNPASQARDVKILNDKGYDLLGLQPLDMFAQTEHIETIGLLQRR